MSSRLVRTCVRPDCGNTDGAKVRPVAFQQMYRCACGHVWDGSKALVGRVMEGIIHLSLPLDTPGAFARDGITMRDVLDGKVPGIDADEIIEQALREGDGSDAWSRA